MVGLIVWIVVLGLLYYCITLLPLPDPFPTIIKVVFILIVILVLLNFAGLLSLSPHWVARP